MCKTASAENIQHSENMITELLINNGYEKRVIEQIKSKSPKPKRRDKTTIKKSTLKIPHLSDQCTARIKRAAEKYKIPVRVVSTPGRKLRNILTSAKPLDKPQCPNNDCRTCKALTSGGNCTDQNVLYHMNCQMDPCQSQTLGHYDGETLRPTYSRYDEH